MRLAGKYAWASPVAVREETPLAYLWPFILPPKDPARGRLVPVSQMPPGSREAVIARMRARRAEAERKKKEGRGGQ